MTEALSERIEALARGRDLDESEVVQQAIERGMKNLWKDFVADQYLAGELSREEAIEELGRDVVREADRATEPGDSDDE